MNCSFKYLDQEKEKRLLPQTEGLDCITDLKQYGMYKKYNVYLFPSY